MRPVLPSEAPRRKATWQGWLGRLLIIGFATASASWARVPGSDLLEVDEAFQVSARLLDAHTVELNYLIAPGYYLYRDRFRFSIESGPVRAGKPRIPAGKVKQDATFGRVATHINNVRIVVPISSAEKGALSNAETQFVIKAISQGCAEAGVCYPPQHHLLRFTAGSSTIVTPIAADAGAFSRAPSSKTGSFSERLEKKQ